VGAAELPAAQHCAGEAAAVGLARRDQQYGHARVRGALEEGPARLGVLGNEARAEINGPPGPCQHSVE
jgi:hypothetical protein